MRPARSSKPRSPQPKRASQLLIHERACQILGHSYRYTNRPLEYPRRHGRPMPEILARLERVLALQDRVEELAQAPRRTHAAAKPTPTRSASSIP